MRPFRGCAWAAASRFVSGTQGNIEIYGDIGYTNPSATRLQHTVDATLVSVRYPLAGVQVDVRPDLTLSAVYRGSYQLNLDLTAVVDGDILVGAAGNPNTTITGALSLQSHSVAVFVPQQAVLGAAWRILRNLTVVADLTWANWSAFQNPSSHLSVDLTLHVPPSLTGIPIPAIPMPATVADANFHDTFVPRVGVEWRLPVNVHTVALRAGYRYEASPVPDQVASTNFMDANRHVIAAGAGVMIRGLQPIIPGGISFDVFGEVQLLENRSVQKADPTDPIGDYVIGGTVFNFGAMMSVVY